nr:hypothetical protein GCM10020092_098590 [Actinoplanes digitatis]
MAFCAGAATSIDRMPIAWTVPAAVTASGGAGLEADDETHRPGGGVGRKRPGRHPGHRHDNRRRQRTDGYPSRDELHVGRASP